MASPLDRSPDQALTVRLALAAVQIDEMPTAMGLWNPGQADDGPAR
jgi:hypothetical protein